MKVPKIGALVGLAAGAVVLLASVAQAAPAKSPAPATPGAASTGIGNGPEAFPNGYQLVESFQYTAPPFAQTHGTVTCPARKQPSGGGVFNESGGFPSAINSSYPSGQSWDVDVNNPTSISGGFIVFAVCLAKSPSPLYKVVTAAAVATNGAQTTGLVTCPTKTVVIGGGAFSSSSSTAVNFNTSLPQNNGWRVDMNNTSGSDSNFAVYAVCDPKPHGYSVQTTGAISNPAGAQTTASLICPGTSGQTVALGGGGFSGSANTAVQMNSSFANGEGGWTVFEQNLSTADTTITGYAICAGT